MIRQQAIDTVILGNFNCRRWGVLIVVHHQLSIHCTTLGFNKVISNRSRKYEGIGNVLPIRSREYVPFAVFPHVLENGIPLAADLRARPPVAVPLYVLNSPDIRAVVQQQPSS